MLGRGQTIFSLSDSSSPIRRHEESKINSNLLVTSSDSASIRKEPLVSLKHVLETDFKRGLFPPVDTLVEESVLAEIVHRHLSLSQGPVEHSRELNDYKNLIKTLVMGMKPIIWSITTTHLRRPQADFKTILTAATIASLCSLVDAAEVLRYSKEQQQPAPEPIDALYILDSAWTLYSVDQSGTPVWRISFMVWLSAIMFILLGMIALSFVALKRIFILAPKSPVPSPSDPNGNAAANRNADPLSDQNVNAAAPSDPNGNAAADRNADPSSDQNVNAAQNAHVNAPAAQNAAADQKNAANQSAPVHCQETERGYDHTFSNLFEDSYNAEKLKGAFWTRFIHGKVGKSIGKMFIMKAHIAFGKDKSVFEGLYQPQRQVAVKCVSLSKSVSRNILNEIYINSAIEEYRGIIRLYGYEFDNASAYFCMEPWTCDLHDLVLFSKDKADKKNNSTKAYLEEPLDGKVLWEAKYLLSPVVRDLMRDIASGLQYLHKLQVIYRDFNPENVKIIYEKKKFIAKLANMGNSKLLNSKHLSHEESSFTYRGTKSWQAPEQLCMDDMDDTDTYAVDMFNFGCVIYYTMTGGLHPFGSPFGSTRETNILNHNFNISKVSEISEAHDLISSLLQKEPDLRPTASAALLHPMFLDSEKRLSFMQEASELFQDPKTDPAIMNALWNQRRYAFGAVGGDSWDTKIEKTFKEYLTKEPEDSERTHKAYNFRSARDLLRLVRNSMNHYRELPKNVQNLVGSKPEGIDHYFAKKFPKLFMIVYIIISRHCKEDPAFKKIFY